MSLVELKSPRTEFCQDALQSAFARVLSLSCKVLWRKTNEHGCCFDQNDPLFTLFRNVKSIRQSWLWRWEWGLCEYIIVHTILGGSPVILWISLVGKPKWLPLKFEYHYVMRTSPISKGEKKCQSTTRTLVKQCHSFLLILCATTSFAFLNSLINMSL